MPVGSIYKVGIKGKTFTQCSYTCYAKAKLKKKRSKKREEKQRGKIN